MFYWAALGTPKLQDGNRVARCCLCFLSLSVCVKSLEVLEQPSPVGLISEEMYFQLEISKTFLCFIKNRKLQYWLHATWSLVLVECLHYNLYQNLFKSSPDRSLLILHCFIGLLWCWHFHWSCCSPSWCCICSLHGPGLFISLWWDCLLGTWVKKTYK